MKKYKKIIYLLFIVFAVILIILFMANKSNKNIMTSELIKKNISNEEIFKNGEIVSNIRIKDMYGRCFDIDNYSGKPLLFIYINRNNAHLIKEYHDLFPKIKNNIDKGLNIIFLAMEKREFLYPDTLEKNANIKIFYENAESEFIKKFRFAKCCGSDLLLNQNHEVLLSTASHLNSDILSEIINRKCKNIFNGSSHESKKSII